MTIRRREESTLHTEIRQQLSAMRLSFQRLLAQIPAEALEAPTANPAWNVRELLFHVILAPELLPQDVNFIRRGASFRVPPALFNLINLYYTRWRARKATLHSIGQQYDLAHQNVLALLAQLSSVDLMQAAEYPILNSQMSGGRTTIADLYNYLTLHFSEHTIEILAGVAQWRQQPALIQIGDGMPPTGWPRLLFRLPIWFYRNDLGWLLGERFLLLNHLGRKSGKLHQTVVEVVDHERMGDVYTIASGWGAKADWYKNLRAHPQTMIQVGRRKLPVEAKFLSAQESGEEMVRYANRYPGLAKRLAKLIGYQVTNGEEGYRQLGRQVIRFVQLHRCKR